MFCSMVNEISRDMSWKIKKKCGKLATSFLGQVFIDLQSKLHKKIASESKSLAQS